MGKMDKVGKMDKMARDICKKYDISEKVLTELIAAQSIRDEAERLNKVRALIEEL